MKRKLLLIPVVFASLSALFGCSNKESNGDPDNTVKIAYSGEGYHESNPIPGDYADDHNSQSSESIPTGEYGSADPLFERGVGEIQIVPYIENVGYYVFLSLDHDKKSTSANLRDINAEITTSSAFGFVYLDEARTKFCPVFLELEDNDSSAQFTVKYFDPGYDKQITVKTDTSTVKKFYYNGKYISYSPSFVLSSTYVDLPSYQLKYNVYVAHNIGLKGIAEMIYYSPYRLGKTLGNYLYAWSYSEYLDDIVCLKDNKVMYYYQGKGTYDALEKKAESLGGYLHYPYGGNKSSIGKEYFENEPCDYNFKKYTDDCYIGLYYKRGNFTKLYRLSDGTTVSSIPYPTVDQSNLWYGGKIYPDTTDANARFIKTDADKECVCLNVNGNESLNAIFEFSSMDVIGTNTVNPYYEG